MAGLVIGYTTIMLALAAPPLAFLVTRFATIW